MKARSVSSALLFLLVTFLHLTPSPATSTHGVSPVAEAEDGGDKFAVELSGVASLVPIPDAAEIILAAPWAGGRSEFGFPSNELCVIGSQGQHVTQITHNRYLYNHFAVHPRAIPASTG